MNQTAARQFAAQAAGNWVLLDGDRNLSVDCTWEGLEHAILTAPKSARSPNEIVVLVAPNGDALSIGVAGQGDGDNPGLHEPLATIEYSQASQDPPYFVVVGDPALTYESGGVVVFRFQGHWTEILRRNCIGVAEMLRVVHHFFLTGTRADWVLWEQV